MAKSAAPESSFNVREFYEACRRYLNDLTAGVRPLPVRISVDLTDTPTGALVPLPERSLTDRYVIAWLAADKIRRRLFTADELRQLREFERYMRDRSLTLAEAQIGRRRKADAAFAAEYQRQKLAEPLVKDTTIAARMDGLTKRWRFAGENGYKRFADKLACCRLAGLLPRAKQGRPPRQ
jgi:hypothetical protein